MKAKSAIEQIRNLNLDGDKLYQEVCRVYREEAVARIDLRAHHGIRWTQGLIASVVQEMSAWINLVGKEVGLTEESIKGLTGLEAAVIYAKYNIMDPVVEEKTERMRRVMARGKSPFDGLDNEGLEAIGNMMLGKIVSDVRDKHENPK